MVGGEGGERDVRFLEISGGGVLNRVVEDMVVLVLS